MAKVVKLESDKHPWGADRSSRAGYAMRSAELFHGCGCLALGMSRAGFHHVAMAEWDHNAVATAIHNRHREVEHVANWPLAGCVDVREVDWTRLRGQVDVISGGPPCQPFGIGGKKGGHEDDRDMWPEAIRAIRETRPDGFLFENVRNLAGPRFSDYLSWIILCLQHPDETRQADETYAGHLARLRQLDRASDYRVAWQVVNAADYGAPQIRHRVIIFGLKARLEGNPELMTPTHGRDRLLWDQYVTRDYWRRHNLPCPDVPADSDDARRVQALRDRGVAPLELPWTTVRDACVGLGDPNGRNSHVFQPGARSYKGHTGSDMDLPSKALKAGDHGVPGGENMVRLPDESVRYFTTREAARLAGLPDSFWFPRSWTETMRQLGNAVPVQLGEAAGKHLRFFIEKARSGLPVLVAAE